MRDRFPGYYTPSDEDFQRLWRTGTFVADTNVLLGLHRYPKPAQDDLLQAFRRLSTRLWIPHQVALEYQENRLDVVFEQSARYAQVTTILCETKDALVKKLADLRLKQRHSLIDPAPFLTKVDALFAQFESELTDLHRHHTAQDTDATRNAIDELFGGLVGDPMSSAELEELYKDGAKRYERAQPPGYLDRPKGKEKAPYYFDGDVPLRREYGDLIVWYQILKEAKAKAVQDLALITDDRSDDWWWNHKGRTIGPRPELRAEIAVKSGVRLFYMYTADRFLEYAKKYLGAQIKDDSVAQVRDVASVAATTAHGFAAAIRENEAVEAVYQWLVDTYPDATVAHSAHFPDLVVITPTEKIGYDIKTPPKEAVTKGLIYRWVQFVRNQISAPTMSRVYYVVVLESTDALRELVSRFELFRHSIPQSMGFILGHLSALPTESLRFVPYITIVGQ